MQSIVFLSLSLLVRSGAGAHLKKVMQMLSYSYAVAALALLSAVSAQPQRGLPQPRYNSADAQAVILKQNFDLNPDGSYQYKWVENINNKWHTLYNVQLSIFPTLATRQATAFAQMRRAT